MLNNPWVVGFLCVMVLITLSVQWLGSTDHPEFSVPPLAAQAVPVSTSESLPGMLMKQLGYGPGLRSLIRNSRDRIKAVGR